LYGIDEPLDEPAIGDPQARNGGTRVHANPIKL
jgi:hypothetical protein